MRRTTNAPPSPLPADVQEAIEALEENDRDRLVRMLRALLVRKPKAPRTRPRLVPARPHPPADMFGGIYGLGERPRAPSGAVFGAVERLSPMGSVQNDTPEGE